MPICKECKRSRKYHNIEGINVQIITAIITEIIISLNSKFSLLTCELEDEVEHYASL